MATEVGSLQARLTLNLTGFSKNMKKAISEVQSFGTQLNGALEGASFQGISTIADQAQEAAASLGKIVEVVDLLKQSTGAYDIANDLNVATEEAYGLSVQLTNLNTMLSQFTGVKLFSSGFGEEGLQKAKTSAEGTAQSLGKAKNAAKGLTNENKKAGTAAKGLNNSNKGTAAGLKNASNQASKLGSQLQQSLFKSKDMKRILAGIVVSQTFYRLLNVMQSLVADSLSFKRNMEQSQIAFKYLLQSNDYQAAGFLEALQDFAISSPMDTQAAAKSVKMLMNMGFASNSAISALQLLSDAAVVSGDDINDTVYSITLALGQMLQSGTVKGQEVKQLINANIPVYEILAEELGMTAQQVSRIGNESINSTEAVMAILRGFQKRYAGASKEMQSTITGALSAIKDSFLVLFDNVTKAPYEKVRVSLVGISDAIQGLTTIARETGAGGVFEALVPNVQVQMQLRNIIGALGQFAQAVSNVWAIFKMSFGAMGNVVVNALNIILPPISIFVNYLATLARLAFQAFPALKYLAAALVALVIAKPITVILMFLWKVIGLGSICKTIAGAVNTLVTAIKLLAIAAWGHPFILFAAALIGSMLVVTGVFQKAINKIKEFLALIGATVSKYTSLDKTLGSGVGFDPNSILQPTTKTKSAADNYKDTINGIANAFNNVSNAADEAGKAADDAFNQSFDEVYTIDPTGSSVSGLLGFDPNDLDLSGLEDLNAGLEDIKNTVAGLDVGGALGNLDIDASKLSIGKLLAKIPDMWEQFKKAVADMFPEDSVWRSTINPLLNNLGLIISSALGTMLLSKAFGLGIPWTIALAAPALTVGGVAIAEWLATWLTETFPSMFDADSLKANIDFWDMSSKLFIFSNAAPLITQITTSLNNALSSPAITSVLGAKVMTWFSSSKLGPFAQLGIVGFVAFMLQFLLDTITQKFAKSSPEVQAIGTVLSQFLGGAILGAAIGGPIGAAIGALVGRVILLFKENFTTEAGTFDWDGVLQALWDAFPLKPGGEIFNWDDLTIPMFEDMKESFKKAMSSIWEEDKGIFSKDIGFNLIKGIGEGILAALGFIFEPLVNVFDYIVTSFKTLFGIHSPATKMNFIGINIILGLLEGIKTKMLGIFTWIDTNMYTPFKTNLDLAFSIDNWLTIGDNIVQGIWKGINNGWSWLTDKVKELAQNLLDAAKSVLGIHSPSTEFAWIGDMSIAGLVNSLSSGTSKAVGTIRTMCNKLLESMDITENPLASWATDVWTTVDTQITKAINKIQDLITLTKTGLYLNTAGFMPSRAAFATGYDSGGTNNNNKALADAVSSGIASYLGPVLANINKGNDNNGAPLRPLYVGYLIADDRGLKELSRKMKIVEQANNERTGQV